MTRGQRRLELFGRAAAASAATFGTTALAAAVAPAFAPAVAASAAVLFGVIELGRARAHLEEKLGEMDGHAGQLQALLELAATLKTRLPLPAMTGYAIAPDCALLLSQLVLRREPELIVETGSGVSTLVCAYALEMLGRGHVVALDHDPRYAARTRAEIARHGLGARASVRDASLEPIEVRGAPCLWHTLRALEDLGPIDLVFDCGPPKYVGKRARYASLPTFASRLTEGGLFVLDTIGDEERQMLRDWSHWYPEFHQEHLATRKGDVLLSRASSLAPGG